MAKAYKAKWIMAQDGNIYEDCALITDEGKVFTIVKQNEIDSSIKRPGL